MAETVFVGTAPNDGTGDQLRTAFTLVNARLATDRAESIARDAAEAATRAARDLEIEGQVASVAASFNIRTWVTGQSYGPGTIGSLTDRRDVVLVSGVWYVATVEHVAGASFATDLAAGKWLTTDPVQLRGDLADTGTGKGMEMIPSGVLPVADYATLKAKAALGFTRFYVTGPLIAGHWQVDPTDTTSAENGGTILVQGSVRIKRNYAGSVLADWFDLSKGGADDTLKLLLAIKTARAAGAQLVISGAVRFVAATVPAGDIVSGYGGNYVYGCSMVGERDATFTVEGKIGFNTQGVNCTLVQNIMFVLTGRELAETNQENEAPLLFAAFSGSKRFAHYLNVHIDPAVTNLTGAYRTGALIQEYGAGQIVVKGLRAANTTRAFTAYSSKRASIKDVWLENTECGVYLRDIDKYNVDGISLLNTSSQYLRWVGRVAGSPRLSNGMDALLVELGSSGTVNGIVTEWPIERAAYIQSRDVVCSNGKVLNGDGFKIVGTDRNNIAKNIEANDLHITLDSAFSLGAGRVAPSTVTTYYSSNVGVSGCSATAHSPGQVSLLGILNFGGFPHTIDTIKVRDSHAVNAQCIAYGLMMSETAAGLAAIDPAQTFKIAKNVSIQGCSLVKNNVRLYGSLLHLRDNEASADAKASYALENFTARFNSVEMNASGGNDDWLFDWRYLDGATTEENTVNMQFVGAFPGAALGTPGTTYRNITMRESNLKYNVNTAVLVANLPNMTVLRHSRLVFSSQIDETLCTEFEVKMFNGGALSSGSKKIKVEGVGYFLYNAVISAAVRIAASGNYYFGKAIAGTVTDQIGTQPFLVQGTGSLFALRGDFAPAVKYVAELELL